MNADGSNQRPIVGRAGANRMDLQSQPGRPRRRSALLHGRYVRTVRSRWPHASSTSTATVVVEFAGPRRALDGRPAADACPASVNQSRRLERILRRRRSSSILDTGAENGPLDRTDIRLPRSCLEPRRQLSSLLFARSRLCQLSRTARSVIDGGLNCDGDGLRIVSADGSGARIIVPIEPCRAAGTFPIPRGHLQAERLRFTACSRTVVAAVATLFVDVASGGSPAACRSPPAGGLHRRALRWRPEMSATSWTADGRA